MTVTQTRAAPAGPHNPSLGERAAQVAKLILGLWMAGVIIAMFAFIPQYEGLGEAGRIVIIHVPTAWVTSVAFTVSGVFSALYLLRRRPAHDAYAVAAAEVGFLFCILATVTGAIFAQIAWGVFWNWDPRETSILVLLLIYAAYFALRSAIDDDTRRRRLASAYNLFALVTMPFLLFIAPRLADSSLHPNCAFLQGSKCNGVVLNLNGAKIGQLGDNVIELKGLREDQGMVRAEVEVRTPGAPTQQLAPTFDPGPRKPADRPTFAGQQFLLALEDADVAAGTAKLNIEAPGTGTLNNVRTLLTFFASIIGFTGLFVWLMTLRARLLLGAEWLAQRERAHGRLSS